MKYFILLLLLSSISLLSSCDHCTYVLSSPSKESVPLRRNNISTPNETLDILEIPGAPRFENYPAVPMQRPSAPLQLKGKERHYRTKLREAYAKGPNFAGYLSIVRIGFGTGLRCGYILDHRTGRVSQNPPEVDVDEEGMFVGCGLGFPAYRLDSNLIIISPILRHIFEDYKKWNEGGRVDPPLIGWDEHCTAMYMVWTGKGFKKLYETNLDQALLQVK